MPEWIVSTYRAKAIEAATGETKILSKHEDWNQVPRYTQGGRHNLVGDLQRAIEIDGEKYFRVTARDTGKEYLVPLGSGFWGCPS